MRRGDRLHGGGGNRTRGYTELSVDYALTCVPEVVGAQGGTRRPKPASRRGEARGCEEGAARRPGALRQVGQRVPRRRGAARNNLLILWQDFLAHPMLGE